MYCAFYRYELTGERGRRGDTRATSLCVKRAREAFICGYCFSHTVIRLIVHFPRGKVISSQILCKWRSTRPSSDQGVPRFDPSSHEPPTGSPCTEVNLRKALDLRQLRGELLLTANSDLLWEVFRNVHLGNLKTAHPFN